MHPVISSQLRQFSPLGNIYVQMLGLEDKNHNGFIDQDAGEGYEEFKEKYGDADIGFSANSVIFGAANSRLEEPEIINHYYLNIRYKNIETTQKLEEAVSNYIYAHNIPLVWLDDAQGTVMNMVNNVLGSGWNNRTVTEDEAVKMFYKTMDSLDISGRTGDPNDAGYYTLPEFTAHQAGYCFEIAQFGFWFFSELKINSLTLNGFLEPLLMHSIIQLTSSSKNIDYANGSLGYENISWQIQSPVQSIGQFYSAQAERESRGTRPNFIYSAEQAVLYNKYDLPSILALIQYYYKKAQSENIMILGEFILENIDIEKIMANQQSLNSADTQDTIKLILLHLLRCYSLARNKTSLEQIEALLLKYFAQDALARQYLDYYRL